MEKEINVLDELNKGACMGRDAIHYIIDKVKDEGLKKELNNQYKEYQKILDIHPLLQRHINMPYLLHHSR